MFSIQESQRSGEFYMRKMLCLLALAATPALSSAGQATRVKLATVSDRYTPTNATVSEPVSLQGFHFEVNPETARARLVVEYTYPDQIVYQKGDDKRGPQPTIVQLPGLKYLPEQHSLVFETGGHTTVCAYVRERTAMLHHGMQVQNTGACRVTTQDSKHSEDDGWQIRRFKAIDTYLEVR